jgi:hypothetical protein
MRPSLAASISPSVLVRICGWNSTPPVFSPEFKQPQPSPAFLDHPQQVAH